MKNTTLYCIAIREHRFAPDLDILCFASAWHGLAYGYEWDGVANAKRFDTSDLLVMWPHLRSLAANNYVRNGCACPDEVLVVPAHVVEKIAARWDDPSLYPLTDEDLDACNGDDEKFNAICRAADLELVEKTALDIDNLPTELLARVRGARRPRECTADEIRKLRAAGYDDPEADEARVLAETAAGAVLYRIGESYAVEGETGELLADLDVGDALQVWE